MESRARANKKGKGKGKKKAEPEEGTEATTADITPKDDVPATLVEVTKDATTSSQWLTPQRKTKAQHGVATKAALSPLTPLQSPAPSASPFKSPAGGAATKGQKGKKDKEDEVEKRNGKGKQGRAAKKGRGKGSKGQDEEEEAGQETNGVNEPAGVEEDEDDGAGDKKKGKGRASTGGPSITVTSSSSSSSASYSSPSASSRDEDDESVEVEAKKKAKKATKVRTPRMGLEVMMVDRKTGKIHPTLNVTRHDSDSDGKNLNVTLNCPDWLRPHVSLTTTPAELEFVQDRELVRNFASAIVRLRLVFSDREDKSQTDVLYVTGSVVAPNLVLTTRHHFFHPNKVHYELVEVGVVRKDRLLGCQIVRSHPELGKDWPLWFGRGASVDFDHLVSDVDPMGSFQEGPSEHWIWRDFAFLQIGPDAQRFDPPYFIPCTDVFPGIHVVMGGFLQNPFPHGFVPHPPASARSPSRTPSSPSSSSTSTSSASPSSTTTSSSPSTTRTADTTLDLSVRSVLTANPDVNSMLDYKYALYARLMSTLRQYRSLPYLREEAVREAYATIWAVFGGFPSQDPVIAFGKTTEYKTNRLVCYDASAEVGQAGGPVCPLFELTHAHHNKTSTLPLWGLHAGRFTYGTKNVMVSAEHPLLVVQYVHALLTACFEDKSMHDREYDDFKKEVWKFVSGLPWLDEYCDNLRTRLYEELRSHPRMKKELKPPSKPRPAANVATAATPGKRKQAEKSEDKVEAKEAGKRKKKEAAGSEDEEENVSDEEEVPRKKSRGSVRTARKGKAKGSKRK